MKHINIGPDLYQQFLKYTTSSISCNAIVVVKILVFRVAVVIDLVVTSSDNACLCSLNGVAV